VVTDPAIKQQVAGWYREGWSKGYGHCRAQVLAAAPPTYSGLSRRSFMRAEHLAQHIEADGPLPDDHRALVNG
jgi:hypothetical protein